MRDYERYIALSRYARWDGEKREDWPDTVRRYIDYFSYKVPEASAWLNEVAYDAILNMEVMPSMRCMMTAGKALEKNHIAAYNCAYLPVDSPRAFDECMIVLLCGTGVGFSVERQFITKLPVVAEEFNETNTVIRVSDSKDGWQAAFKELISLLYSGQVPSFDFSAVRPAGARLKTFGGRASGPEPLNQLFVFAVNLFRNAAGRKLTSIECHDLMCKIGEVVVVGGVRRSALISLSNLTDDRMRRAKTGQWWLDEGQRALANNSVCYTEKPDMAAFMEEWTALMMSGSGERGIFNREAAKEIVSWNGRRDPEHEFGCNPCSEIILRPYQFCNLTEAVVRPYDTSESLKRKVEIATILGTLQSTLTSFKGLRKVWKDNTEEERLLGVSLTGIMDNKEMCSTLGAARHLRNHLQALKEVAIATNKEWADRLGIPQSAAITCVKPSGTVSQLVDAASGIHPRYSEYYIRTVRADKKDPLATFLREQEVPCEDDITKPDSTCVFSFPMKSPESAVTRDEVSAIDQLELWKVYQESWCEHKPSITVYVRENEWMEVGAWVYRHFDIVSGISFLPYSDHVYQQAPYQPITKEEYETALKSMPTIAWDEFVETEDNTEGTRELACVAGVCEI